MGIRRNGARANATESNMTLNYGDVGVLSKYLVNNKEFVIPHNEYESNEEIQNAVVELMDQKQKTEFGTVTWTLQTEKTASDRVVRVFLVMQ